MINWSTYNNIISGESVISFQQLHEIPLPEEIRSEIPLSNQQAKIKTVAEGIAAAQQRFREQLPDWEERLGAWVEKLSSQRIEWQPIAFHDLNSVSGLNHPVQ